MIRSGLVSVTFRHLGVAEIVELAADCALEGIEWGGDVHVPVGDLNAASRAKRLTHDAGLAVVSYGSYYRVGLGSGFDKVLSTAVELGAPNIRVWAGSVGSASIDPVDRKNVTEDLKSICQAAQGEGIEISLEYHVGTLTDKLESARQLIQEVNADNLKLYWQPFPERGHKERVHEVESLTPHLSHLHVFQWIREAGETVRRPLAEGNLEWPDYLRAAKGDRFALLEFVPNDDPSALSGEAKALRDWL